MHNISLHLEIVDGERKGETLLLPVLLSTKAGNNFPRYQIKENESLRFKATLPFHWEDVQIAITDKIIEPTKWSTIESGIEYIWEPQKFNNRYTPYFKNYFGVAGLELLAKNPSTGIDEIITSSEIEVLSSKLNAERVNQMLDYLFNRIFSLHAESSATKQKGGIYDGNGETPSQRLDVLEHICCILEKNIPVIIRRPLTMLRQLRVVEPVHGKNLNASEASIQWLAHNTDQLVPETDRECAHLQLDNQLYRIKNLAIQKPIKSTDIPENRRLLGVLKILQQQIEDLIFDVENKINDVKKKSSIPAIHDGYESFFGCISHSIFRVNKARISRCERLKTRIQVCSRMFENSVPVKQPELAMKISAKVKSHHAYREIMLAALKLYGTIDWKQEDVLLAIHSISKLYELFCLEQLKEILPKVPAMKERYDCKLAHGTNRGKHGAYTWKDWNISLLYQQIYRTFQEGDAVTVINSEGWTEKKNGIFSKRKNTRREPDYVIDIKHQNKDYRYLIVLDAKYTNSQHAFKRDIPSLVMKYIHGLHLLRGGYSPVIGLFILFPEDGARSYHQTNLGIMGNNVVLPILTTHTMSPKPLTNVNPLETQFYNLLRVATRNSNLSTSNIEENNPRVGAKY